MMAQCVWPTVRVWCVRLDDFLSLLVWRLHGRLPSAPSNTVHALYAWGRPPCHVYAASWRCLLTYLLTSAPSRRTFTHGPNKRPVKSQNIIPQSRILSGTFTTGPSSQRQHHKPVVGLALGQPASRTSLPPSLHKRTAHKTSTALSACPPTRCATSLSSARSLA